MEHIISNIKCKHIYYVSLEKQDLVLLVKIL